MARHHAPAWPARRAGVIVAITLVAVVGLIGVGGSISSRAIEQIRREGHGERLKGYRGLTYSNPDDPRLWVPKLLGIGATINFANPWAWPMMLLLIAVPLAVAALGLFTASR